MVMTYRRPGVYLEESLLINPADIAGTVTVACFVGVAQKGPINEPTLCESWSDFVTLFGDFNPIAVAAPSPDRTTELTTPVPTNLAGLQGHANYGNGKFTGPIFTGGQYVTLAGPPATQAHYEFPAAATNKGAAAPGSRFANEPTVTAEDSTNAAKLTGLGFIAAPTSAWTATQAIYLPSASGTSFYRYQWNGTAWVVATGATANNGAWASGAMTGTPATAPPSVLSYLPFAVYSFFQNGGRFAWVIRSVSAASGKGGVSAEIAVNGQNATGDPLQSFTLIALSVGSWGENIKYQLVTQDSVGLDPDIQDVFALQILVKNSNGVDEVVETWPSLSVKGTLPGTRRVDSVLNDSAAGSRYVRVVDLNEAQPRPMPTSSAVALDGGVDPAPPDGATLVTAATNVTKLEGPITLNIVGYLSDSSVQDSALAADKWVSGTIPSTAFSDRQDIFIVNDCCPPRIPGSSSGSYMTTMQNQQNLAANTGDSYSASYGPWIIIPHPARVGTTVNVPPGGAVMGMMARIDATVGVFRAPAGVIAGLTNAVGVQTKFTDSELGSLNAQNINVIRSVVGAGICCMGGRTRKSYGTDRYVSARRTLIYIKEVMRRSTQFAVFENNDQRLWSALRMSADRILRPLWEAGGLRGASADLAYFIRCDDTLNTPSVIQSGEVRMECGVALEYPAEFVIIRITQFDQGTFTNEVQPAA